MAVKTPLTSRWPVAAMLGGLAAAAIGSLLLALAYYARFPDIGPDWSWGLWAASIAIIGPLTGAMWGLGVCGGIVSADRLAARGWSKRVANPLVGGALGGVVGGVIPSVIGIVGYGSLHAPYAGTTSIAFSVLVAIILFATFGSMPRSVADEQLIPAKKAFAASLLASVLVVVPFGMVVAGTVATLMPEDVVRDIVAWIGESRVDSRPWVLGTIGVGVAAVFGPLVGSFVGATTVVARILRGALFFRAR